MAKPILPRRFSLTQAAPTREHEYDRGGPGRRVLLITCVHLSAIVCSCIVITSVHAQSDSTYTFDRYTVDSGGGSSRGSGYTLNGTVGQPEADSTVQGGGYELTSGFWAGGSAIGRPIRPGNPSAGKTILIPLIMNE